MDREASLALSLLRTDPDLIADARTHGRHHNTQVGAVLSLPIGTMPRWAAEAAVKRALAILDQKKRR